MLSPQGKVFFKKLGFGLLALLLFVILIISLTKYRKQTQPEYYAGEIFGQKIPQERFKEIFSRVQTQSFLRYGKMYETIAPLLDLDTDTWDQLILLHEARNRNITVSDKDIINEISKFKAFHKSEKFDTNLYRYFLRSQLNSNPETFEEGIRDSLTVEKLYEEVTASIKYDDNKLLETYKNHERKSQLTYVVFDIDQSIHQIEVSESEIPQYYEAHNKDFTRPPSINVEYVRLDFPKDGGVQKEVENKFKAKAIYEGYAKNPSLNKLGEQQGYPAKETGFFSKENPNFDPGWDFATLMKVYKMKVGELSEPIERKEGFLVFLIKEKKDAYVPDFDEAMEDAKSALIKSKAKDMIRQKANAFLGQWRAGMQSAQADKDEDVAALDKQINKTAPLTDKKPTDQNPASGPSISVNHNNYTFIKTAAELGAIVRQTTLLSQRQLTASLQIDPPHDQVVFALHPGNKVSEIIEVPNGYLIAHQDIFEDIDPKTFKTNKETFRTQITEEEKAASFSKFVTDLKKKASLKRF